MNKLEANRNNDIVLRILDELNEEPLITQRTLSSKLGVALGLVNTYIKRLAKKGYIKVSTIPQNRVKYILTPNGFSEKVRLTYEYMRYSIDYFKDTRHKIDSIFKKMITSGVNDILIWGDGEIAELLYISLRGLPLRLIGVVDSRRVDKGFFDHNIYSYRDFPSLNYDAILVASFNNEEEK
ncbi:MAG TPA: winged helix-turn-helix transcriptional regulator, partial [Nitrospirae bacterium]|nr:winged helix-turn-helix transcriptional regulator [Nitrospirota bacterium]